MSRKLIPLSAPEIVGNEWKYVKDCLDTGWVSSVGEYVNQFERMIAEYVGTKDAVATVNGTTALHVSLLLAGIKPGDEVIVPTLTFIASVNAICYCGGSPVFMDCEPEHLNLDVGKTTEFLERECKWINGKLINKKTKNQIKAIIAVHIFGHPVDMDPILEAGQKYNLRIIEDATESLGSRYKHRFTGSIGDIGCFSFNGNKIITTGGGGMIVSNNKEYLDKARYLTQQAKDDPFEYIHNEIGYNYRLTNLQAALGIAQLEKLNDFVEIKRRNAAIYRKGTEYIRGLKFMPEESEWAYSNHWLYYISVNPGEYGMNKNQLLQKLNDNNCQSRPIWKLNHLQLPHKGFQTYRIENAGKAYDSTINLPSSLQLTSSDIEFVVSLLKR